MLLVLIVRVRVLASCAGYRAAEIYSQMLSIYRSIGLCDRRRPRRIGWEFPPSLPPFGWEEGFIVFITISLPAPERMDGNHWPARKASPGWIDDDDDR